MKLSIKEIFEAAVAAGFTPDQATTWTAIALAESGGETGALNGKGEHSVGLWQVNLNTHYNKWGNLHDPVANARAAYEISAHGTDMRPWTTTHSSHAGTATDYRTYLDQVSAVTGYTGDSRCVEGYGSPLPPPLDPSSGVSSPDVTRTTSGSTTDSSTSSEHDVPLTDPASDLDADQGGLTDAFERIVGGGADTSDTDQEGLSDAFEADKDQTSQPRHRT
jgi:hypothetical protein